MPLSTARLELRLAPENKALIEMAAKLSNMTITAFVTEIVVAKAKELAEGPVESPTPSLRPIGGWSFTVPEGWDEPLADLDDYR